MSPRISVLGILGLVGFVALAMTALRFGSSFCVMATAWLVMFWLSASLLGAFFGKGRSRVFWTGFAVFGWIYMLLVHNSLISTTLADEMGGGLRRIIESNWRYDPAPSTNSMQRGLDYHEFAILQIRVRVLADLFLNLAFAFAGGSTGALVAGRDDPDRNDPQPSKAVGNP